jgi:hypothetical protein
MRIWAERRWGMMEKEALITGGRTLLRLSSAAEYSYGSL